MIKLLDLLLEVGDSTPFSFTGPSVDNNKATYNFKTDAGYEYEVNVKQVAPSDSPSDYYLYIDFKVKSGKFSDVTGENVPLKIMATVTDIVKKEINRLNIKIKGIIFSPAKTMYVDPVGRFVEKGSGADKRKRLYAAYIQRNVPGVKQVSSVPKDIYLGPNITYDNLIVFEFPKETSTPQKSNTGGFFKRLFKE